MLNFMINEKVNLKNSYYRKYSFCHELKNIRYLMEGKLDLVWLQG